MQCKECGMYYVKAVPSNRRQHAKYHDEIVNGFPYVRFATEKRVLEKEGYFVTLVDRSSNRFEIARAEQVGTVGYTESGYDSRPFDGSELYDADARVKVFMIHTHSRTIGILVVERAILKWKMAWKEYDSDAIPPNIKNGERYWSGRFVWIHRNHRRKGLAGTLVRAALDHLHIPVEKFAYSSQLSESGKELAKSISPCFLGTR